MAKYVSPEGLDDALKAVATTIGSLSTRISTNAQGLQTLSSEIPTKVSQLQNDSGYTTNKGTVTGVKINGTTKSPSSGVVDLGTVITAHQDISGKVDKVDGKGLSTNDFTTTLKNKLNGIASGAEVNQNAFSNIAIGDTMLAADSKTDLLTIAAGDNITLTPDTSATKVTISASVPTLSSLMGSSAIGGTSSYIYWNGSKWATKSLGTLAFSSATSFPASDVYSWAKASTKPSYTKSEVGLGNVENKSSATIRSEITKANVTSALGTGTGTTKYLREDGSWATPPDTNTNTTYSFSGGTNQFTVTPSNGSALTVTITPSISNNVTYSGTLTSGQVAVLDGTSGKIKASGYTIAKSVPSDAKFTDTTYSYVAPKQDGSEYGLTASGEKYEWNNKQNAISDLSTIRSNATNGATAYSWGNHASAGYCTKSQIENGVFPNMRVGLADDLGDIEETLDEEYAFQPTANPNEIRDGYAQIESLKGNSLVWNQFAPEVNANNYKVYNNANAQVSFANGIATVTVSNHNIIGYHIGFCVKSRIPMKIGHVYAYTALIKSDIEMDFDVEINNSITNHYKVVGTQWTRVFFYSIASSETSAILISPRKTFTADANSYSVKDIQFHDLTQMFGEGNEPTTVEEFERRCPKGMPMDYNEGEVIHFNGDAIKSVGFNQWDEEWEVGGINTSNGKNNNETDKIRGKNFIRVTPSSEYYCKSPIASRIFFYDSNKNYISNGYLSANSSFTILDNAYYIRFRIAADYGTTYNHDICINLSDPDKNGTYEPYTEFRRDLPTELFEGGMKSAGTAHDEIYFDKAKGKYIKVTRIGKVDWETVNIAYSQNVTRFEISSINKLQGRFNIIASIYTNSMSPVLGNKIDKTISGYENRNIYINDYDYTNIDTYRAAMIERGIEIYYELAEPIVEEIDIPYMDYQVSNDGTEEIVSDTPTTPIKARVTYNFDTIGTVRQNRFDISNLKIDLKSNYQPLATAITQIKVNGTSVATSGIANIPIATSTADGAMSSTHVSKLSSVENAVGALSYEKLDKPSAWVTASLTLSGAAQHSSNPVKFRKCGSLLTIQGAFTFTYGSTSDGTAKLFKLPSGYIPAQSHSSWQYATGNWMWRLYIDTGGQAYIHSIVNPKTNAVNNSSSMTFLITVSFYID
jgi:hypothetical protein